MLFGIVAPSFLIANWSPDTGIIQFTSEPDRQVKATATPKAQPSYQINHHKLHVSPEKIERPLKIMVSPNRDLFSSESETLIWSILSVIQQSPHHQFYWHTAYPERFKEWIEWTTGIEYTIPHLYVGTEIHDQTSADARIPALLDIQAASHYLYVCSLKEPVRVNQWLKSLPEWKAGIYSAQNETMNDLQAEAGIDELWITGDRKVAALTAKIQNTCRMMNIPCTYTPFLPSPGTSTAKFIYLQEA